MVTHINFAVDDELAERAREIKDEQDWSWPEYFEEATQRFERKDLKNRAEEMEDADANDLTDLNDIDDNE